LIIIVDVSLISLATGLSMKYIFIYLYI